MLTGSYGATDVPPVAFPNRDIPGRYRTGPSGRFGRLAHSTSYEPFLGSFIYREFLHSLQCPVPPKISRHTNRISVFFSVLRLETPSPYAFYLISSRRGPFTANLFGYRSRFSTLLDSDYLRLFTLLPRLSHSRGFMWPHTTLFDGPLVPGQVGPSWASLEHARTALKFIKLVLTIQY